MAIDYLFCLFVGMLVGAGAMHLLHRSTIDDARWRSALMEREVECSKRRQIV